MKRLVPLVMLLSIGVGLADTLTLRDGKKIQGTYLGGDARSLRMVVGDKVETFEINNLASLHFGPTTTAGSGVSSESRSVSSPAPSLSDSAAIPAGTTLVVRLIDDVDSEVHRVGQTFRASLDKPVVIDGRAVVPRGAEVVVKLVEDKEAGKLSGRAELTLDVVSLMLNGRTVNVVTEEVTTTSESRTGQTATTVGGLAGLGAIIGAIAGGGRGAAIGAVSGAGAGTAVQVLTKGPRVRIPSETRLEFTLQKSIRI